MGVGGLHSIRRASPTVPYIRTLNTILVVTHEEWNWLGLWDNIIMRSQVYVWVIVIRALLGSLIVGVDLDTSWFPSWCEVLHEIVLVYVGAWMRPHFWRSNINNNSISTKSYGMSQFPKNRKVHYVFLPTNRRLQLQLRSLVCKADRGIHLQVRLPALFT